MATMVVVVQHAEKERLPGDPGLTPLGQAQASATATFLAAAAARPIAVYCSPLRRARETAAPIADRLGVPTAVDDRLRERMNWEGPGVQSFDDFLTEWRLAGVDRDLVPTSGDSSNAAAARFLVAIEDIAVRHPQATVVVVAHGGVTTDLLRTLFGDGRLASESPSLIDDGVPCCGLTRLRRERDGWRLLAVATTDHLNSLDKAFPPLSDG